MRSRVRFYDLRNPDMQWEEERESLEQKITAPNGEKLSAITLPGASLCADLLVVPNTKAWAGVTVAIHQRDFEVIKSTFQLATSSMVTLIEAGKGAALPRYKDFLNWGWLEVNWLGEQNVEMLPAQTNQALWYTVPSLDTQMPKVVVLALEDIDYMLKEGPEGMVMNDVGYRR